MRWLKAAIARLRTTLSLGTATPISSVGPVPPEPTTSTGSKPTAPGTSPQLPHPHQHQHVSLPASVSSEAVPPTTAASNSGKKTPRAATTKRSKAAGTKPATPAPRIRQPAKSAQKASRAAVQPTPLEPSPAPDKVHVPTLTEYLSGGSGKPKVAAPRTRQPAKPAAKLERKPVKRATSAKNRTSGKASARTRTASPSGASGT